MAKTSKGSTTSYHLVNEQPLLVSPSLAVAIGLPEAMILQQLHFWLQTSPHIQNGKPYVYNTYKQWQAKFPFWSWETMKRSLLHMEKMGIVEAENFNRNPIDKTKWYTINYEKLNEIDLPSMAKNEPSTDNFEPSMAKNEPSIGQNLATGQPNLSHSARVPSSEDLDPREIPESPTEENPPLSPHGGEGPAGKRPRKHQAQRTNYTPGFQRWWTCYPPDRRVSKPQCFRIWHEHNLEPQAEDLCAKIERLKITTWRNKERCFIVTSLVWMNQGRYEDELVPLEVAQHEGMRERLSDREYRGVLAGQRFLENHGASTTGQTDVFEGDAGVIDGVQYRAD